jgi:class 3 adenylate cyclase
MSETRKIAAILAADVVGFSRMAGADEDRMLARFRMLRARCTRTSLDRRAKCRYAMLWRVAPKSQ